MKSYRIDKGPSQRIIMDMGDLFHVPVCYAKELANCIEQLLDGYEQPVFKPDREIEEIYHAYAKKSKLNRTVTFICQKKKVCL